MASLTSKLTNIQKQQLCGLLGDVNLTLLFKASVHGYNATVFHKNCDRQGPTLLVAYNNSGYIYGGYTSKDYTQSRQNITDEEAFLFYFPIHGGNPLSIKINNRHKVRIDDSNGPSFGQQLYFMHDNKPILYDKGQMEYRNNGLSFNAKRYPTLNVNNFNRCNPVFLYEFDNGLSYDAITHGNNAFSYDGKTLYGNNTQLCECEVYNVKQNISHVTADQVKDKPWRNILWTEKRKQDLMKCIKDHKPLVSSVNWVRILMIGPVGVGKSSFFNSINSIFMGRMTSKAMAGSSGTSLTTQFRTYPLKDGREGNTLPFVLCDTMGLEEQTGAGLDIEDINSILQGLIPDRYQFSPLVPFHPDEKKSSRPSSLQEKIHCVVYMIDATKISLMSSKLEEKLAAIRKKVNSLGVPQIVLMTKVDEACPLVEKDLQNVYVSSYIKTQVQEVSSRLGVPVSCVLPVKNYSQELELNLNCDLLLLTAVQQMLNYAEDYLDDVDAI